MTAPQFSYTQQPQRAVSGMIVDINACTVDSFILNDGAGAMSGKAILQIPNGFPSNGIRLGQRVRTGGTRELAGFVIYNPGKPGDPATMEYQSQELIPVCRQGRIWVYCENFAVDPLGAADTWFTRNSGGIGDATGNLRYGDNDGGTCTAVPVGKLKPLQALSLAGGAALVQLDIDFRNPAIIAAPGPMGPMGPGFTYRGAYNPNTAYVVNDVVYSGTSTPPGSYVCLAPNTAHLPSGFPAEWGIIALNGAP